MTTWKRLVKQAANVLGGRFIDPPKVSEECKDWLAKWQPAGDHKKN